MGQPITDDLKFEIIEKNPLREILQEYGIEVNRNNKMCCPFHKEKTGSCHVYTRDPNQPASNKNRDFYKCYGCGESGDAITFIMKMEEEDFLTTIRRLAVRAGIPIPEERKNPRVEKLKEERTNANRAAYTALMADKDALDYVYSRGLNDEDIRKWRIGMVPWNYADRKYAGRIVFGIMERNDYHPTQAKTIALAYRVRTPADYIKHGIDVTSEKLQWLLNAKYYNDETDKVAEGEEKCYEKKKVLYGMNYAAKPIKKAKFAVLMEGYMDVIMAHKYGLENAVAACGTSITEDQVKLLKKYTNKVFLWLDGDDAGLNGMIRSLPLFLKEGFKVMIVESPGMDPAEVAETHGNLIKFIEANSHAAVQLVINKLVAGYDNAVNLARTEALGYLLPAVTIIQQHAERIHYATIIEQRLGVSLKTMIGYPVPDGATQLDKPVQDLINETVSGYDTIINKARTEALEELIPLVDQIKRVSERINYTAVIERRLGVTL